MMVGVCVYGLSSNLEKGFCMSCPLISEIFEVGGVGVGSVSSKEKLTVKRVWERFGANENIMGEDDFVEISSISNHPLAPSSSVSRAKGDNQVLVFLGAREKEDGRFFKALRYNFHGGKHNKGAWEETSVPAFAFWQDHYRVMLKLDSSESSAA